MRASRIISALAAAGALAAGCGQGGTLDTPAPQASPAPPVTTVSCGASPLPPCNAILGAPIAIAVSKHGKVHFANLQNRVLAVDDDGKARVIAGTGGYGFSGDGGPATAAQFAFYNPNSSMDDDGTDAGLAFDLEGRLLIADGGNRRVRRIETDGTVRTVTQFDFLNAGPRGLAVAADGSLHMAYGAIWRLLPDGRHVTLNADAFFVRSLAFDASGTLYAGDDLVCRVRRIGVDGASSCLEPLVVIRLPNGFLLTSQPVHGLAVDRQGGVLFTDSFGQCIRRIAPGTVGGLPFAGLCDGLSGFAGDGGPALQARFAGPVGIAADDAGNLYVADSGNRRIRKVDANGIITSITADLRPN
jgi:sugar lactone lactonase YvrE